MVRHCQLHAHRLRGAGWPQLRRWNAPLAGGANARRTPPGHRRDRSALVLARSVAGRFRRHRARGIPQASGIRLCRLLPRALSHFVVFDTCAEWRWKSAATSTIGCGRGSGISCSSSPMRFWPSSSAPRRATWPAACRSRPTVRSPWPSSRISRRAATWACLTGIRYRLRSSPPSALAAHGATYLSLKTEGGVHDRSTRYARRALGDGCAAAVGRLHRIRRGAPRFARARDSERILVARITPGLRCGNHADLRADDAA